RADLCVRRACGQPHDPIEENAFLRPANFRLVSAVGDRVEDRFCQPVENFFKPGQRRIDRMLRDETRRPIELKREADGHVRCNGCWREWVERVAGGSREQFAMTAEARRTGRDSVENLLWQRQL